MFICYLSAENDVSLDQQEDRITEGDKDAARFHTNVARTFGATDGEISEALHRAW